MIKAVIFSQLCFCLGQILEKVWENPSNRRCADCGMKGKNCITFI